MPTLLERDFEIPPLEELLPELAKITELYQANQARERQRAER